MPDNYHDVIICGHGLAGAVLAHHLKQRGISFHVFDRPREGGASLAAAGVINPVSLRRDVPTWRAHEMLRICEEFYAAMGAASGTIPWHPIPLIKIFPTPNEEAQWRRAMTRETLDPLLSIGDEKDLAGTGITAPFGLGIIERCAWLDIRTMLDRQRSALLREGALTEEWIDPQRIGIKADRVVIGDRSARWMIHCEGPFPAMNGIVPVKGEVLTVRIPGLSLEKIVHRGIFILPIGNDLYRIGSTFEWNDVWSGPSEKARDHLLGRLREVVHRPIEVIEHRAGVRPASRDRRPVLGKISHVQAVLNGLGSRGGMIAPWCAIHLVEHLFDGRDLDPEVDLRRSLP